VSCEVSPTPSIQTPAHPAKETAKITLRQQTIMELFQTEKNYVGILNTILKVLVVHAKYLNKTLGCPLSIQFSLK